VAAEGVADGDEAAGRPPVDGVPTGSLALLAWKIAKSELSSKHHLSY
jgi:hypothetical protein